MKKFFYIAMTSLLVFSALSCNKDNPTPDPNEKFRKNYGVDGITLLPEAIDIGLEVNGKNIKWGSFNFGATSISEYGDYFQWGDKYTCNFMATWSKYKFGTTVNSKSYLTKYCTQESDGLDGLKDDLVTLLPEDDVVQSRLGGKWRMPTKEEFEALLALGSDEAYTFEDWVSLTDAEGNELKDKNNKTIIGFRITQKATGKSVFFPAAGCPSETSTPNNIGKSGCYWASSLNAEVPQRAYNFYFTASNHGDVNGDAGRFNAFSVRPVWVD